MPYCWKCGTKLDEEARFCPTCGTPVAPAVTEPEKRRIEREERRPISFLTIFLIILLATGAVIAAFGALAFLPLHTVGATEAGIVPYETGVDTLNLDLTADVARVNIVFEDLVDKLVTLNASATARVGALTSPDDLFDLTFNHTITDNVLTVTADIDTFGRGWPWYSSLRVTCDLSIDPSLNTSLDVKTRVGIIVLDTQAEVVLDSLSLEATTGGIEVNLVEDIVVAGDVSVKTTTGGVEFSWDNVLVTKGVLVDVKTTTGGVEVDIKQEEELLGNVTMKAEATTGGVNFAIEIRDDVGAKIESSVIIGGIDVERQVNFYGTKSPLTSDNYPSDGNFNVSLKTTTGGIEIRAEYTS